MEAEGPVSAPALHQHQRVAGMVASFGRLGLRSQSAEGPGGLPWACQGRAFGRVEAGQEDSDYGGQNDPLGRPLEATR